MEAFYAECCITEVRFSTASSISSGDFSLIFKLICFCKSSWNFFQFIMPLIRDDFAGQMGEVTSMVESTGELSEYGLSRLSIKEYSCFGMLITKISKILGFFWGGGRPVGGIWGTFIEYDFYL